VLLCCGKNTCNCIINIGLIENWEAGAVYGDLGRSRSKFSSRKNKYDMETMDAGEIFLTSDGRRLRTGL
jgi:hypothetical protein